jgi:hypothetical protein
MIVRAAATSSNQYVDLPSDWLENFSLIQVPGPPPVPAGFTPQPLRYMGERQAAEYNAANYGQAGPPIGYTIIGNQIELVPPPNADIDLTMVYYQRISPLSAGANWLIVKSPDLYLYSALLQAEPYLKNDERIATWAQIRQALMESIRAESEASLRPRSGMIAMAKAF